MIPATIEERRSLRPMGRNRERYQQVVLDWHDVVRAADDLGFWGVSTIEHHFHSEGYEVGPNPALFNAYWAAITKKVRVGQLGFVMSAQNPLRVAEDVAILDHLTKGRTFVGFARGYQSRWTNILGQHLGGKATLSPTGMTEEKRAEISDEEFIRRKADDLINRSVFEEQVDMVLDAWAQESIESAGRWQVPFPHDEGIEWTMEATKVLGAPGEMDESNRIRRISVVPSLYTSPRPPIFVSSNASQETVEYCGPRGFIPTYFSPISRAAPYGNAYVEAAKRGGLDFSLGENQALVRWTQIAETEEKARRDVELFDVDIFRDLYAGTTPMMFDHNSPVDSVLNSGLWITGTPEKVRNGYVKLWESLPAEYVVLIWHFAQMPKERVIENMALFMEHVKPALDEMTSYEKRS
jgi:alkanesulfonate monooxygenase SsuD/methylene tetrahydromethanopterin reductase-like flavin-dependent oxidoreductase (luciferase family)